MDHANDYVVVDGELKHYGVLGMKWGVRRGRTAQAYEKASKKLKKLQGKVEKADAKAYKKGMKADSKASSVFATQKGAMKADFKAKKASRKASVQVAKAKKWLDEMDKAFKDTDVKLSEEQVNLGKSYTERLINRNTARDFR